MDKNNLSGVLRKARSLLLHIRRSVASGGHIDEIPEFDALIGVAADEATRKLSALDSEKSKDE
ncbi:hypothetical protein [Mesorhizobium sp. M00.F.Ca.ET.216.01.1.1]|uniref:hypothetical protein n=1 Tax=Mesorhizobium sp. M00.F.Ca.ET.216.01.1.1 TaxID=2500528 RepID=UPI000FDB9784|nr:hypothetical protein [Mesorhizobium sp. M00.F.Ca.ET.216.01.1.1]TGQ34613.1 hypothetical protein EN859_024510 [Mesorhizobium sp. M00.F.Ca.ET.216.01.1.1]TJW09308.1 MAG: hypothetical protein E5W82_21430 [Mesorhizobium sp.]TJW32358.1 MAG: hypothetical protein E5W83_36490 [Mesorhizobium sp.]